MSSIPTPIEICQFALESFHAIPYLNQPWWASIMVFTVLVRAGTTLPLARLQYTRTRRLAGIQPILAAWKEALTMREKIKRDAGGSGADYGVVSQAVTTELRQKASELYKQHNCHPIKTFLLPWIQIPVFITMSLTLRSMSAYPLPFMTTSEAPIPGFKAGGELWFTDLTLPDPTWILPVCLGLLHNTNLKLQAERFPNAVNFQRFNTALRVLMLVLVPLMAQAPSAVTLYWVASAAFSLIQNTYLRHDAPRIEESK
ncbi:hypothetical protein SmJEL517_g02870 [Synchytrium microbalum]|uniref:Membrane insertase YidC/Oxa/ALB C-terminal domain-containing protein n=1 Tax=Synchytrium microbalum TaxID=1806994 RepID=A0A507C9C8_9FUNG|nr:uncharacterized protein SmJEL517_g02870 [Synchytrium microbalum]TPX34574.1 hypothetical protein SmJEL517_g02870 [Synchytrium microbalum]